MQRKLVSSFLLAVCLSVGAAAAASPHAKSYKAAVKLEVAGDIPAALAAFEAIPTEHRTVDAALHIASCKRKLGRMLESARDYEAIIASAKDAAARDTAATDLEAVRQATPRLRITVGKSASDLAVELDGNEQSVPATVAVDPGKHVVRARRKGKPVFEQEVSAVESSTIDIMIDAPAPITLTEKPHPMPTIAPIDDASGRWKLPVGVASLAIGAASLGVGTVYLIRSDRLRSETNDLAAGGDPLAFDRASEARSAQTIARVGFVVGTIASVGGAILLIGAPWNRTTSAQIAPAVGTNGAGLVLRGAW